MRIFAHREQRTDNQTKNSSKTEATLSPVDRRGTRANKLIYCTAHVWYYNALYCTCIVLRCTVLHLLCTRMHSTALTLHYDVLNCTCIIPTCTELHLHYTGIHCTLPEL